MPYPTAAQASAVRALVAAYGAPARVVMERVDGPYARVMVVWWQAWHTSQGDHPRVVLLEPNGDDVFFDPVPYDITE